MIIQLVLVESAERYGVRGDDKFWASRDLGDRALIVRSRRLSVGGGGGLGLVRIEAGSRRSGTRGGATSLPEPNIRGAATTDPKAGSSRRSPRGHTDSAQEGFDTGPDGCHEKACGFVRRARWHGSGDLGRLGLFDAGSEPCRRCACWYRVLHQASRDAAFLNSFHRGPRPCVQCEECVRTDALELHRGRCETARRRWFKALAVAAEGTSVMRFARLSWYQPRTADDLDREAQFLSPSMKLQHQGINLQVRRLRITEHRTEGRDPGTTLHVFVHDDGVATHGPEEDYPPAGDREPRRPRDPRRSAGMRLDCEPAPSVRSEPEWMGTPAAARRLGITTRTLYRLIDEGRLPAYRIGR